MSSFRRSDHALGLVIFFVLVAGAAAPALSFQTRFVRGTVTDVNPAIVVTTTSDVRDDGDLVTSLREAIITADLQPGDDTILLAPGQYHLAITGPDGVRGDLDIVDATGSLTIQGAPGARPVLEASALQDRVFHVHTGATVVLENLEISQGGVLAGAIFGGGLFAEAGSSVTLRNCLVVNNRAAFSIDPPAPETAKGGGIFNQGNLTLDRTIVDQNFAESFGGGIYNDGVMTVTGGEVSGNMSGTIGMPSITAGGAGVFNSGNAMLHSTTMDSNQTPEEGGAIYNEGALSLTDCVLSRNISEGLGGAMFDVGSSHIVGGTIQGNTAAAGGGMFAASDELTISGTTISGNTALFGTGGGIDNNTAHVDGAIIMDSKIVGNRAATSGGGIFNFTKIRISRTLIDDNTADFGGGIENRGAQLSIDSSTISNNEASCSAVTGGCGTGGGIDFFDPDEGASFGGPSTITNSTISGNSTYGAGGGIAVEQSIVEIHGTTIVGNDAIFSGGGLALLGTGGTQVLAENTLIGGNRILAPTGAPNDCQSSGAALGLQGRNLIESAGNCAFSGETQRLIRGASPFVGPLQDNGGPTPTHALNPGSPAMDAGDCASGGVDQRGRPRPVCLPTGSHAPYEPRTNCDSCCDIGAFEYGRVDSLRLGFVKTPIRWCALRGAPSAATQSGLNDALTARSLRVTQEIFFPGIDASLGSAAAGPLSDYPILDDADTSVGQAGDVVVDLDTRDLREYRELIGRCRAAWEAHRITSGVTAVLIHRFLGPDGAPLNLVGVGGRPEPGDCASQLPTAQIMVADVGAESCGIVLDENVVVKTLGHEVGHTISLRHGDGIDQDGDCVLDEGPPEETFDPFGMNLMQYSVDPGTMVSDTEAFQAREHILECLPGRAAGSLPPLRSESSSDLVGDVTGGDVDPGRIDIYDFGFVLNPDGTSTFVASTAQPIPPGVNETFIFTFLTDLDRNAETGGTVLSESFPPAPGIEVIAQVAVSSDGAQRVVSGSVRVYSPATGTFEPVNDPRIAARIVPNELGLVQIPECLGDPILGDLELGSIVDIDLPIDLLTGPGGWDGTSLNGQVRSEVGMLRDIAPDTGMQELLAPQPDPPRCTVTPGTVSTATTAVVHASLFVGGTELQALLGTAVIGTATADPSGAAEIDAAIPGSLPVGEKLIAVRSPGLATEAACAFVVVNFPPVARCRDASADAQTASCDASASIDGGSSDPDGDSLTLEQTPPGPYDLGTTPVTLTVRDRRGGVASCSATVTVADRSAPALACPPDRALECPAGSTEPDTTGRASATDNCTSAPTVGYLDSSTPGCGATQTITRTWSALDASLNGSMCTQSVRVADTTPPAIVTPALLMIVSDLPVPRADTRIQTWLALASAADLCGAVGPLTNDAPAVFPVGTTTVAFTTSDACGNPGTGSSIVTVGGSRTLKRSVLDETGPLTNTVTDHSDRAKLIAAERHLARSLEPSLWLGESHLLDGSGSHVFNEEKNAAKKFDELIRHHHGTVPEALLRSFIGRLLQADRRIATLAIEDARAAGGDPREILKADRELIRGDLESSSGKPDKAIERYRESWKHALKALEHALAGPDGFEEIEPDAQPADLLPK